MPRWAGTLPTERAPWQFWNGPAPPRGSGARRRPDARPLLLRRRPDGIGQGAYLFMTFALGAAMLLPAYGVSLAVEGGFPLTAATAGRLLPNGVLSSAVAFFTWNKAVAPPAPESSTTCSRSAWRCCRTRSWARAPEPSKWCAWR